MERRHVGGRRGGGRAQWRWVGGRQGKARRRNVDGGWRLGELRQDWWKEEEI